MGRFDALTQLDGNETQKLEKPPVAQSPLHSPPQAIQGIEEQAPAVPPLADHSSASASAQPGKKHRIPAKNLQTSKSINALQLKRDKFDKYSTYLRPGYKKELKSIALERDCKDYEVLDEALTLFFETRKK
jgi:hypothetical protein